MISFRTKSETGTSIAILGALGVLVLTGLFMLFVPAPTTEGIAAGKIRSQRELDERVDKLKADKKLTSAKIASQVWTEPIAEIGPTALESITAFARTQKLTLLGFRPQKTLDVNGLTQLPFLISVEGPYPNIMKFVRQLEASDLRMGTSLVQVSANDPNSDLVNATIGVVAYKLISTAKTVAKGNTNATQKEN